MAGECGSFSKLLQMPQFSLRPCSWINVILIYYSIICPKLRLFSQSHDTFLPFGSKKPAKRSLGAKEAVNKNQVAQDGKNREPANINEKFNAMLVSDGIVANHIFFFLQLFIESWLNYEYYWLIICFIFIKLCLRTSRQNTVTTHINEQQQHCWMSAA